MSARRNPPSRFRRALGAVAVTALTGALALLTLAVFAPDTPTVAVDVEPARADEPPPMVPARRAPARPPAATTADQVVPSTTGPESDTTGPESESSPQTRRHDGGAPDPDSTRPSPLAELLDEPFSAIPADLQPRARPERLQIGSIDVSRFPVRPVGLEPDGQLEVPDETEIGWYRYGSTPGEGGATVLAAHVSWNRTAGPFALLGTVDPGELVEVQLDDGSIHRYQVVERAIYDKYDLPTDRIWRTSGDEELVLITCGGDFNPEIRRYRQNIVVYAVPVS